MSSNDTTEVNLCHDCQTMKHLNQDGLCGRCAGDTTEPVQPDSQDKPIHIDHLPFDVEPGKQYTVDPKLVNADSQAVDELDKHHDDDCTIDVMSEGYPCICWVKDYRAYAERLATEARIDEWEQFDKWGEKNAKDGEDIIAYVKNRIKKLAATLTKEA